MRTMIHHLNTPHIPGDVRSEPLHRRGGFSLLETTIAVGILGIGLIMVAAVFPVALTQHRNSTEQSLVIEVVSKAHAMLAAKVNPADLWVHPAYVPGPLPGGTLSHLDSPWYLLPTVNLAMGNDCWDAMVQESGPNQNFYANWINGAAPSTGNVPTLFGLDILSDRLAPFRLLNTGTTCPMAMPGALHASASPFTDDELMEAPNRLVWYGFYRRRASGSFEVAIAVCKQRRNQRFAEQDVSSDATPYTLASRPTVFREDRRLPVPWRVTVARPANSITGVCAPNQLSNAMSPGSALSGSIGLATLAPVGSKMMISGAAQSFGVPLLPMASGRILTVSDIVDSHTVEVVGELSGVPCFDLGVSMGVTFDVWVFPPAIEGGAVGRESPVLDWKVPL